MYVGVGSADLQEQNGTVSLKSGLRYWVQALSLVVILWGDLKGL